MSHLDVKQDPDGADQARICLEWQRTVNEITNDMIRESANIDRLNESIRDGERRIAELETERAGLGSSVPPGPRSGRRPSIGRVFRDLGQAIVDTGAREARIADINREIGNIRNDLNTLQADLRRASAHLESLKEARLDAARRAAREGCATIIGR